MTTVGFIVVLHPKNGQLVRVGRPPATPGPPPAPPTTSAGLGKSSLGNTPLGA